MKTPPDLDRVADKVLAYDQDAPHEPLKVIAGAPDRPLVIGEIEIPCYVLEDETRVLSQRGLQSSIGLGTGGGTRRDGAPRMIAFLESTAEKGIDIKDLTVRLKSAIEFQPPTGGRTAIAYPAVLLTDICRVVLAARRAGVLTPRQSQIADRCELIMDGLAEVGIIALVDEATGYQQIREQRALATILEKFIAKELHPWTRTFPLEFYTEICRLKNWPSINAIRRPSVIGKYTNDIVYERIAPGVLEELKRLNPSMPGGGRKWRHHQWFTPDPGYIKLNEHLVSVVTLMKISDTWAQFIRHLKRRFPKLRDQLEIDFKGEGQ